MREVESPHPLRHPPYNPLQPRPERLLQKATPQPGARPPGVESQQGRSCEPAFEDVAKWGCKLATSKAGVLRNWAPVQDHLNLDLPPLFHFQPRTRSKTGLLPVAGAGYSLHKLPHGTSIRGSFKKKTTPGTNSALSQIQSRPLSSLRLPRSHGLSVPDPSGLVVS